MGQKLRFWKNDKRESETHPHLSNGKPVEIECSHCHKQSRFWAKIWINAEASKEAVVRMVGKLDEENGSHAIVSLDLTPVIDQQASQPARDYGDEEAPF